MTQNDIALQITCLSRSFGKRQILTDLSLNIKQGVIAGLIGPSGCGKSVLLKTIAQVAQPDKGRVSFSASSIKDLSLMFQEGALFDSLSVFDNVAFPLVQGRVPASTLGTEEAQQVKVSVSDILARVGLSEAAFKMPGQLSGGMRRRVSLARALVSRPKIVLLDDPTCGLDPVASSVIMDLIVEIYKDYRPTMLVVSHDLRRLLPVVEETIVLYDQQIRFQGSLKELECCEDQYIQDFVRCRYDFSDKVING